MNSSFRQHPRAVATLGEYLDAVAAAREFFPQNDRRGSDRPIWFRGQNSLGWRLAPKAYRPEFLNHAGPDDEWEPDARDLFKSRAVQLVGGHTLTDWEWYFLMQHHGAPTRLLDWSENPLVALFFAIKGHSSAAHRDAAVWLLDPWWLNAQNRFLTSHGVEGPILPDWSEARQYLHRLEDAFAGDRVRRKHPAAIEAPHVDPRLNAQASRFVVFGTAPDLSQMFAVNRKDFGIGRLAVKASAIPGLEKELAQLGVHTASVFPDLDGLGSYVCEVWSKKPRQV